jgi:hypothetical protein
LNPFAILFRLIATSAIRPLTTRNEVPDSMSD